MVNDPAAKLGSGKQPSSKARKQPSSGNRITGKQPATKPGSDPRPREIVAGTRNHPTDRARVLVSCARVLVES